MERLLASHQQLRDVRVLVQHRQASAIPLFLSSHVPHASCGDLSGVTSSSGRVILDSTVPSRVLGCGPFGTLFFLSFWEPSAKLPLSRNSL